MFKNARSIVGLGLLLAVAVAVVVGWVTGFFGRVAATVSGLWSGLMAWINQPLGWEDHLVARLGVLLIPAIILLVIFAIADD